MTPTLRRETTLESVLEAIRSAILDGTYAPSMQIKQSVVAEELGVSQGLVREALSRLVEEGLVESIPYRGHFVYRLSEQDVEEIYQMRAALESLAAQLAFPKINETTISQCTELVKNIIQAAEAGDGKRAVGADLAFHRHLVQISGNSRLLKSWDSLLAQCHYVLRNLYDSEPQESMVLLAKNHLLLIEALRSHNIDQMMAAIEEHMDFARRTLLERWTEINEGDSVAE